MKLPTVAVWNGPTLIRITLIRIQCGRMQHALLHIIMGIVGLVWTGRKCQWIQVRFCGEILFSGHFFSITLFFFPSVFPLYTSFFTHLSPLISSSPFPLLSFLFSFSYSFSYFFLLILFLSFIFSFLFPFPFLLFFIFLFPPFNLFSWFLPPFPLLSLLFFFSPISLLDLFLLFYLFYLFAKGLL